MDFSWTEQARFAVALIAIVDPLAAIPLFLGLTSGFSVAERKKTARVTALAVFGVLAGAALAGEAILGAFGTSLPAFRVGGGVVLLLMAVSMLNAEPDRTRHTPEEDLASTTKESVAVVPLGVPLLAGPGAISAVILQMNSGDGPAHVALVLGVIALLALACWLALRNAERIGRLVGPIGMNVVIRLFGLVLAAIGVEFIAAGIKELFPGLA
ncbi:MAG: NAAT family transporter [Deltaproteobacteria bacterium]|nr:NAAT family transporter [Deltaproteobacteria bacterium]